MDPLSAAVSAAAPAAAAAAPVPSMPTPVSHGGGPVAVWVKRKGRPLRGVCFGRFLWIAFPWDSFFFWASGSPEGKLYLPGSDFSFFKTTLKPSKATLKPHETHHIYLVIPKMPPPTSLAPLDDDMPMCERWAQERCHLPRRGLSSVGRLEEGFSALEVFGLPGKTRKNHQKLLVFGYLKDPIIFFGRWTPGHG